jgi:hypothetical protein
VTTVGSPGPAGIVLRPSNGSFASGSPRRRAARRTSANWPSSTVTLARNAEAADVLLCGVDVGMKAEFV